MDCRLDDDGERDVSLAEVDTSSAAMDKGESVERIVAKGFDHWEKAEVCVGDCETNARGVPIFKYR